MTSTTSTIIPRRNIDLMIEQERDLFIKKHPNSLALSKKSNQHYLFGVPLHWMADWGTPAPLFVNKAKNARFECVDHHQYADFCLGDTGAMFGHSPDIICAAMSTYSAQGFTCMLPSKEAVDAGAALSQRFGLPYWQLATTATDANRFLIRWARAITQRSKILVFNGCYHGTVDDVFVDLPNHPGEAPQTRNSLLGQVYDLTEHTEVVEFNDIEALKAVLERQEVAVVLMEPAMTNCGMVLPEDGYLKKVRELCDQTHTLLAFDETHTISTGYSGYTGICQTQEQFAPDFVVLGKAIAGGYPCAVYGMSEMIATLMRTTKENAPPGHSGIGTTLSGSMLTMRLLATNLNQVATPEAFELMTRKQSALSTGLRQAIETFQLPWSVTQLGARSEFQFCPTPPKNGSQAHQAMDDQLELAIHLYLLNRGIMITPFHNMTLVCPTTTDEDISLFIQEFTDCLAFLCKNEIVV